MSRIELTEDSYLVGLSNDKQSLFEASVGDDEITIKIPCIKELIEKANASDTDSRLLSKLEEKYIKLEKDFNKLKKTNEFLRKENEKIKNSIYLQQMVLVKDKKIFQRWNDAIKEDNKTSPASQLIDDLVKDIDAHIKASQQVREIGFKD